MILEIYKMWNRVVVEDCLTFPVNLWWIRVLALCKAATKDCVLIHGINLDYRQTFLEINFLRLIHPEIILKKINLTTCKETMKNHLKQEGQRLVTQVKTDKIKAQLQCRHLKQSCWLWVLQSWWKYRRTTWSDSKDSKYRNCNSTNSLIHNRSWCGKFDSNHKSLLVLVFHRMLCCGSKKWRWLILWTSWNLRDQFMERIFQTSRCWTRRLLLLWTRSSQTPSPRRRSASRSRKAKKRIGFYMEDTSLWWSTTTFEWLALMTQY